MINSLYDNFKHWSNKGSVYIISDFHFDDVDCLVMDKNWIKPEEQVAIINKMVHKNDTLICLGDVGNVEWVAKLKAGYKVLIMGNHDGGKTNYTPYFDEVYEGPLFIAEKILLSHEPIKSNCWFNIHGHQHDGGEVEKNSLNVAANICHYTPIDLGKIIKSGALASINSIHRETINRATQQKKERS